MTNLDPRIGMLNSGKFYAYLNGHGYNTDGTSKEPFYGTREEVEIALGLRATPAPAKTKTKTRRYPPMRWYAATLTNPDGYCDRYDAEARTKAEARKIIADAYRNNTPSKRNGFYSFAQQTFRWIEEEG